MNSILILLTVVSLVFGQQVNNQLTNEQHMEQHMEHSQQTVDENPNLRSSDTPNEKSAVPPSGTIQAFILNGDQLQHIPPHQKQQILKIVGQQQQFLPQQEKIVLQLGNPINDKLVIESPLPQVVLPSQQVVKIVEEKKPIHHPEPVCHLFGRKGECVSVPSYFGCMRHGGVLFMSFTECAFNTGFGCCVKNIVPFLSQSN